MSINLDIYWSSEFLHFTKHCWQQRWFATTNQTNHRNQLTGMNRYIDTTSTDINTADLNQSIYNHAQQQRSPWFLEQWTHRHIHNTDQPLLLALCNRVNNDLILHSTPAKTKFDSIQLQNVSRRLKNLLIKIRLSNKKGQAKYLVLSIKIMICQFVKHHKEV